MNNFISIVNEFNLVIYTDENSCKYINTRENPRIKIVLKPLDKFYNYKYKDSWIKNHEKNFLLKDKSCWELNMLWSEKIQFVKESIEQNYFESQFYGWCDIGYFRNRPQDIHTSKLSSWGKNTSFLDINPSKIHYACVQNDDNYINYLFSIVNNKTEYGLPIQEIPAHQNSIAGGFFILHKDKIDWWSKTYDTQLHNYFQHDYLVKDDQILLVDCILSNLNEFVLFRENSPGLDSWFLFQRYF